MSDHDEIAKRAVDLSGQFIQAAFHGNAFGNAASLTLNTLRPSDPRTLQVIARAAAVGWGLSSGTAAGDGRAAQALLRAHSGTRRPPSDFGGGLCPFTWPG